MFGTTCLTIEREVKGYVARRSTVICGMSAECILGRGPSPKPVDGPAPERAKCLGFGPRAGWSDDVFTRLFLECRRGATIPRNARRERAIADGPHLHARHGRSRYARAVADGASTRDAAIEDHPRRRSAPVSVDVSATPNAQGLILPVSISIDSAPDTGATHAQVDAFTQSILPVNLYVKAFPGPGKYTIQLIVTTPTTPQATGPPQTPGTTAQSTIWRLNLTSASEVRPATLVVDQNAVTLTGVQGLCLVRSKGWCVIPDDDPVVTVHVRDKTGNWPLADVMARMEPGLKAPGTALIRHRS